MTFTVDIASSSVLTSNRIDGVDSVVGEEGVRRLYGIALADPELANAVGSSFSVAADASTFTTTTGTCAAGSSSPDRCVVGGISTPTKQFVVYADLSTATLVRWNMR